MAEKPRGNILYEIFIVILVVALVVTILYPSKVWQNEAELESVCRSRMDAIHQMEFRYIFSAGTYTDSIPKLKEVVMSDPGLVTALDSVLQWDQLVTNETLEAIVEQRQFPMEIRESIREQLVNGAPLGHLMHWDSLIYRLIAGVQEVVAIEMEETTTLDTSVNWFALVGENDFWNIIDDTGVPSSIRNRTRTHVRRGRAVEEASGWERYKPVFYEALDQRISNGTRGDIWVKDDQDEWEDVTRAAWEDEMDLYSQEERDSVWVGLQRRFWDKEKEILWKKQRRALWKTEGEEWKADNEALWDRAISQQWQSERKKSWTEEQQAALTDSALIVFRAKKDSLWRTLVDTMRSMEYADWMEDNRKQIDEVVYNLWEVGRRLTWEEEAQPVWLEEKEEDREALWIAVKEDIWNAEKGRFWRDEETRLAGKESALRRLDETIAWVGVLGADRIGVMVDGLSLPDNQEFWKHLKKSDPEEGSALYLSGVVGLLRETLLENVGLCPLTETPYLIAVNDTATVKKISIRCPIVEKDGDVVALVIDPVTQDSTYAELGIPSTQKIFGGSAIKNHGFIDEDTKKSWVKRGR